MDERHPGAETLAGLQNIIGRSSLESPMPVAQRLLTLMSYILWASCMLRRLG